MGMLKERCKPATNQIDNKKKRRKQNSGLAERDWSFIYANISQRQLLSKKEAQ